MGVPAGSWHLRSRARAAKVPPATAAHKFITTAAHEPESELVDAFAEAIGTYLSTTTDIDMSAGLSLRLTELKRDQAFEHVRTLHPNPEELVAALLSSGAVKMSGPTMLQVAAHFSFGALPRQQCNVSPKRLLPHRAPLPRAPLPTAPLPTAPCRERVHLSRGVGIGLGQVLALA